MDTNIVDCPKDGNCLFSSIADQLQFTGQDVNATANQIRNKLVSYLAESSNELQESLSQEEFISLQTVLEEDGGLEAYSNKMKKDGEWGDGIMLITCSMLFGLTVIRDLDQMNSKDIHLGKFTSHSKVIHLGYSKIQSHYVSIREKVTEGSQNMQPTDGQGNTVDIGSMDCNDVATHPLQISNSTTSNVEQLRHRQPALIKSSTESRGSSGTDRRFKSDWTTGHPWLRYDTVKKLMFCTVCETARLNNTFVRGCAVLKRESVTKHEMGKGTVYCIN